MANKMNLDRAFQLNRQFWRSIAAFGITIIKTRTARGIGITENGDSYRFPEYTEAYADLKSRGFRSLTGERYAPYGGVSLNRQVHPPNLRLTGDMLGDLKLRAADTSKAIIGWRQETANKVAANERMRRSRRIAGFTKKEIDQMIGLLDKEMINQWNKRTRNVTVRVG